ncbi:MAG: hypothetical protein LBJ21_07820, partial [Acidobacteriota bacterium]|nr:hypothetical protein [Acidobacteriota bacterium]
PKTPNSALRSFGKILIYLYVNSAFASVASLDFEVFGGCLYSFPSVRLGVAFETFFQVDVLKSLSFDEIPM